MGFQMAPKLVTLNDLERRNCHGVNGQQQLKNCAR